ncbi:MAG: lytic transglycosylase domain-containing protein [candidate division SR1 bacterium]|nr:lytic transglycosylase domain-containing protein [candidate division SR1 bacterium]
MREQIQKYYADKKIFRRIIAVIVFLLIIIFLTSGNKRAVNIAVNNELNFAGEVMPIEGKYQLNIERFDRELALLEINAAQFIMIYKRWNLIIPTIEKQLKNAGLPDDLKYIPIIESALRDNVVSSAGAAGLWQLMPGTAQKYGLIVTTGVDERYDVAKSTAAAISHLKELSKQFNKRTLVAAAYNRGENGLQRSLESQYTNNFYDLWLNNETSRYVFRLLSMKYMREHKYSFFDRASLGDMYTPFVTKSMSVKSIADIADRARNNTMSYYEVRKLNPWIMSNSLPEGKWNIEVFQVNK